jgi:hypothetical protein
MDVPAADETIKTMNSTGHPLNEPLSQTLASLLAKESGSGGITLGEVVLRIGDRGFGLLLIVLSLPSALPVPAPGYSTPFGILIAILALQMLAGMRSPWLPRKASAMKIHGKFADQMLAFAGKFFARVEFLIRPRLRWVGSRGGLSFLGILVLIMACLMILPIPLTNTFPAFVIFLIGIGLTEEDGLACIGAAILGVFSVLLYGFVVYFFMRFGMQGIDMIKDWIRTIV